MTSIPELFSLESQTALVTGGTRGIGQAMTLALAEAGANIIIIQRDTSNTDTKTQVEALGRKCSIHVAELSDRAAVSKVVPTLLGANPDLQIRVLLTCAGIQRRYPAHEFPIEDWDEVMQVNLTCNFVLCRDVGAHMRTLPPLPGSKKQRGSIINVASLLSFQGGINIPAYAASKGGIGQLTKALSNQWAGEGVNVNAIAPGYIATEMNTALINDEKRAASILERIPAGRWGSPEDFKGAVVYLASRASAYVTGEILTVDGGWMAR